LAVKALHICGCRAETERDSADLAGDRNGRRIAIQPKRGRSIKKGSRLVAEAELSAFFT
jgi:hypothetical protein